MLEHPAVLVAILGGVTIAVMLVVMGVCYFLGLIIKVFRDLLRRGN